MMPTAHRTAAEYHFEAGERGLADLGKLGLDEPERAVEVLAALTHAVLSVASALIEREHQEARR